MTLSILTIGDEICIGQIVNTNAAWIASECIKLGFKINIHSTIGDEKNLIISEINRLQIISDIVIVTGGLGPTHDDITKDAICEYFGTKLIFNEQLYEKVSKYLSQRNVPVLESHKSQAMIPENCQVLDNNFGTASGMLFYSGDKILISLPGVPTEMQGIMTDSVIPLLGEKIEKSQSEVMLYKTLQTTGISESSLADKIGKVESFLNGGSLAFLPSYHGVRLRIGISDSNFILANQKIENITTYIKDKVGKYIYSETDEELSSVIGKLLKARNETVSVAESCTGGMLGAEFTEVSGSSEYFLGGLIVYSNQIKENILKVKQETLIKYGAVSEETAVEMAKNVRTMFNSSFGIGITGVAGPTGGSADKPVGTVWIALSDRVNTKSLKFMFSRNRKMNRERAVFSALNMLYKQLIN